MFYTIIQDTFLQFSSIGKLRVWLSVLLVLILCGTQCLLVPSFG